MSKICLVRPLLSPTDFNGYPLNLLILASALREAGHDVELRDYDFLKELDASWSCPGFTRRAADDILRRSPDFIGITALCSNYVLALDLASELKRIDAVPHITLGGPHVSLCPRETLERHPAIDTAVIGEGEITYPQLVDCVVAGGDLAAVDGIACRRGGTVEVTRARALLQDLDLSPRPAYDLIDVALYARTAKGNYLELYAGSGCPFTCTFCSTSIVWERRYRTMSARRIVDEMQYLSEAHGAVAFNLIHDNLTTDKKFVREIASEIRSRGLTVRWGFSSRIDTINLETIRTVVEAGCDYVFFGVESGSTKIQRTMRKKLKLARIHEAIGQCLDHGIMPTTSFILGFPDEDADDIAATVRLAFACRVRGARRSFINLLSAYTGTPVMKEHFEGMSFSRDAVNTTMVSYLEDKHYRMIEADRFLFSSYYSLDFSQSPLTATEYRDLVDFYTICLFRYRHVISFLINDLEVDPIGLFRRFGARMASLGVEARNDLALLLTFDDLRACIDARQVKAAKAMLLFDDALWRAGTEGSGGIIFSGPVEFDLSSCNKLSLSGEGVRHYLLRQTGTDVRASTLEPELSWLYEAQGLPALRCSEMGPEALAD